MRCALITGVTGQDGSYLAELLLKKGYKVIACKRRTSTICSSRLENVYDNPNFYVEYFDLDDAGCVWYLLNKYKPDEIYNLAAQSHVRASFDVSENTVNGIAMGTLRLLNAMKTIVPNARFYQASSSEMFGDTWDSLPFNENTKMMPASPYSCAKLFAHNLCRNYREAYGLHCSSGILFNHETLADFMPLIFKEGISGEIDIKPIKEIVLYHTNKNKVSIDPLNLSYQETSVLNDLFVWDAEGWTKVKYASGYPHNKDKNPSFIVAKNGAYFATAEHICIMEDGGEKQTKNIQIGDKIHLCNNFYRIDDKNIENDVEMCRLAGFIVGDGYIDNKDCIYLTGKNIELLKKYADIFNKFNDGKYRISDIKSGFAKKKDVYQIHLTGKKLFERNDFYTSFGTKRVPKFVLNSNKKAQLAFLEGYNDADGMKANKCIYNFKNFKTNSATLAMGLIFLLEKTTKQSFNINVEQKDEKLYYSINVLSDKEISFDKKERVEKLLEKNISQRQIARETGMSRGFIRKVAKKEDITNIHRKQVENNVVKKKIDIPNYNGWFFDLETESGTFNAGIGKNHIHNSPRRGETFVTRKITRAAARIKLGLQDFIELGNLDAKRDWGFAGDYCEAMWLMLQQENPDDYVIATGEMHSVREFLEVVFECAEIENPMNYVKFNEKYLRPHEVPVLMGDSSKARNILKWEPKIKFRELAKMMYEADLALLTKK